MFRIDFCFVYFFSLVKRIDQQDERTFANFNAVRSPDSRGTLKDEDATDANRSVSSGMTSVSNAMMSFASRCLAGEHIPGSTLKNIVMLAVAEESLPPPAHVRSHRRFYGGGGGANRHAYGQVNANSGSFYDNSNRYYSNRSLSLGSRGFDGIEPLSMIQQRSRSTSATRPSKSETRDKPAARSRSKSANRTRTSPNRNNNNNTIKRRTRTRTPAPPVPYNSTRQFLYIAPFCDKYGTQTKVSFYVDNPEVNYSELYNIGNEENPAVVLENVWDEIPPEVMERYRTRQAGKRQTRATTPRRSEQSVRRRSTGGRARRQSTIEWSTPKPIDIEDMVAIEPKQILFSEDNSPAPVEEEKTSPSPPRQRASQLLRKRPTEKVTIDEATKDTAGRQRQRTFLTPNSTGDEDDIYLRDDPDHSDSDESDTKEERSLLGIQEEEMRRSFEDFFTEFKRRDSFDSENDKRSLLSKDGDYPTTQDDMINKTVDHDKNIITRLRKRSSRAMSLPNVTRPFAKHIVGDEIEYESGGNTTGDTSQDDDDDSSSSESSSSSDSSDESSSDDKSTLSTPTKMSVEENIKDLGPEDILRVVTGDAKPSRVITPTFEVVEPVSVAKDTQEIASTNENDASSVSEMQDKIKPIDDQDMTKEAGEIKENAVTNGPETESDNAVTISDDDPERLVIDESRNPKKSVKLSKRAASPKKLTKNRKINNADDGVPRPEHDNGDAKIDKNEPVLKQVGKEQDKTKVDVAIEDKTTGEENGVVGISKDTTKGADDGLKTDNMEVKKKDEDSQPIAKTDDAATDSASSGERHQPSNTKEKSSSSDDDSKATSESDSKAIKRQIADLQSAALILDFWRTGDKIAERKLNSARSVASIVESTPPVISKRASAVVDLPVEKIFYTATRKDYSKADAEKDLFKIVQKDGVLIKDKTEERVSKSENCEPKMNEVKDVEESKQQQLVIESEAAETVDESVDNSLNDVSTVSDKGTPDLYNVSTFIDLNTPTKKIDETPKRTAKAQVEINAVKKNILAVKNEESQLFDAKNNKDGNKTNKILYVVRGNDLAQKKTGAKVETKAASDATGKTESVARNQVKKSGDKKSEIKNAITDNTRSEKLVNHINEIQPKPGKRTTRSSTVEENLDSKVKPSKTDNLVNKSIKMKKEKIPHHQENALEILDNIVDDKVISEDHKSTAIVVPDSIIECEIETTVVGAVEEVHTEVQSGVVSEAPPKESKDPYAVELGDLKSVELTIVDTPIVLNEEIVSEEKPKRSKSRALGVSQKDDTNKTKKITRSKAPMNDSDNSKVKLIPDLMPIGTGKHIRKEQEPSGNEKQVDNSDSEGSINKLKEHIKSHSVTRRKPKDVTNAIHGDDIRTTKDLENLLAGVTTNDIKKADDVQKMEPKAKDNTKSSPTIVRPQKDDKSKDSLDIKGVLDASRKTLKTGELGAGVKTPGQLKYIPPHASGANADERPWQKLENILGNNNIGYKKMEDYKIPKKRSRAEFNDLNATQYNKVSESEKMIDSVVDKRQTKRSNATSDETKDADASIVSSTTSEEKRNLARRTAPIVFVYREYADCGTLPKLARRKDLLITLSKLSDDVVQKKLGRRLNEVKSSGKRKNATRNGPTQLEKKPRVAKKRVEIKEPASPRRRSPGRKRQSPAKNAKSKRRLGMAVVINNSDAPKKRRRDHDEDVASDGPPVCGDTPKRRSNRRKSALPEEQSPPDHSVPDRSTERDEEEEKYPVAPGAATELMYPSDDSLGSEYFQQQFTAEEECCEDFRDDSSPEPLIVEIEEVQVTSSVDNLTLDNPPEYSADELKQHFFS